MTTSEHGGDGAERPAVYRLGRSSIIGVTVIRPDDSTTRMVQVIFPAEAGWDFDAPRLVRSLGIPYDPATDRIATDDAAQASWTVVLVE